MSMQVSLSDPIDNISGGMFTVGEHEKYINQGNHYYVSGYDNVASSGTINFTVSVPDTTTRAHMMFRITGTGQLTMEVYEGTTGVSGGTSATPINNNRNSSNTSGLTVLRDPTITSDGTLIDSYKAGTSGTFFSASKIGNASRDMKIILKQNTIYLFRITNIDASANDISFKGMWFEI